MTRSKLVVLTLVIAGIVLFGLKAEVPRVGAESDYQELQLLTDVLTIVRRSYVEEVPFKDLVYGAINGILVSLDPHSGFMPPDVYKEMKVDTRGEFGGLGIEITIRDGVLTIVAPIEDTPADRVGLQAGDQILKIEDAYTKDMEIMTAVRLMRGTPGSEVSISVMRDDFDKPKIFTLTREVIKIKSVKKETLEDGYGYVRLVQFQEKTAEDLAQALKSLREENDGSLNGLVLDLRNNPGGLLDQAVEVADMFLEEGLIVYTKGREAESQMEFTAKRTGGETDFPMVLLINGGSASASEIVAGALQDHDRAVVMGTRSFGKGSVQTIIPLSDDSGLRLTTAKYYTPNGTSIQATGIVPDIEVLPGEVREMKEIHHVRERDLKNHFDSEPGPEAEAKKDSRLGDDLRGDYQLLRALDLLKGWRILKGIDTQKAA